MNQHNNWQVDLCSTAKNGQGHFFIFRISEVRVLQRDLENIVVNHIFQFFAKKKSQFQV